MDIRNFWNGLGRGARAGLVAGTVSIALATAAMGWWALRADYQVLFAELSPQDAAAMTAELERLKVPYRLADEGASILVEKEQVYAVRMKLMGKDLPLHGAVGFELFNNSDFGMTEFAQKINYQRALQGELTRTILSLAQVKDARVLLVLPEQRECFAPPAVADGFCISRLEGERGGAFGTLPAGVDYRGIIDRASPVTT